MGEPATTIPAEPQAPSPAPAAPTPAATPQATPEGAPGASQAQPGASSPESDPDHRVPYPKFREVQQNYTKTTREFETYKRQQAAELQKYQAQLAAAEKERAEFREFQELLNENPEVAEQLIQAMQNRGRVPARGAAPAKMELPPELGQTITQMQNFLKNQAQREQVRAQAEEDRKTAVELDGAITDFLTQKNYDPEMLGEARNYVIARCRVMENPSMEDVPYLLGQWYKSMETFYNKRVEALRAGRKADGSLPVTPGPTPGTVTQPEEYGANDEKTASVIVDKLRQLGWGQPQG